MYLQNSLISITLNLWEMHLIHSIFTVLIQTALTILHIKYAIFTPTK